METLRAELENKGLSKNDTSRILKYVLLQFTNACYDAGLSEKKAKELLYSKEGLEMLTDKVRAYV